MSENYISAADTAKELRLALKDKFPGAKFSVRTNSYSMGASIRVEWIDGPSFDAVKRICEKFSGATFDGMIDLKEYHSSIHPTTGEVVHWGADYVFPERRISRKFAERIIADLVKEHYFAQSDLDSITISGDEDGITTYGVYVKSDYYHTQKMIQDRINVTAEPTAAAPKKSTKKTAQKNAPTTPPVAHVDPVAPGNSGMEPMVSQVTRPGEAPQRMTINQIVTGQRMGCGATIGEYKGHPVISLGMGEGQPDFSFGAKKAETILDNIEAIRAFASGGTADNRRADQTIRVTRAVMGHISGFQWPDDQLNEMYMLRDVTNIETESTPDSDMPDRVVGRVAIMRVAFRAVHRPVGNVWVLANRLDD